METKKLSQKNLVDVCMHVNRNKGLSNAVASHSSDSRS